MTSPMSDEKDKQPEEEEKKTPSEDDEDDDLLDDDELDDEDDDLLDDEAGGDEEKKDGDGSEKDKQNATLNIQRKKWRERALKAEEEAKALKEAQGKKDNSKAPKPAEDKRVEERLDFRFDHADLSSKEVREIEAFANAKDVSLERAYKSGVIQTWLERRRKKQETEGAAPTNRRRGSEVPKGKDPNEMTDAEFDAYTRRIKETAARR